LVRLKLTLHACNLIGSFKIGAAVADYHTKNLLWNEGEFVHIFQGHGQIMTFGGQQLDKFVQFLNKIQIFEFWNVGNIQRKFS
jgi:hypothetical protein